jgi:hypothetical protein
MLMGISLRYSRARYGAGSVGLQRGKIEGNRLRLETETLPSVWKGGGADSMYPAA